MKSSGTEQLATSMMPRRRPDPIHGFIILKRKAKTATRKAVVYSINFSSSASDEKEIGGSMKCCAGSGDLLFNITQGRQSCVVLADRFEENWGLKAAPGKSYV